MRKRLTTALVLTLIKLGSSVTAFLAAYGILSRIAYLERGYEAVGGELIAAAIVGAGGYLLAEKCIRYVSQMHIHIKKTTERSRRWI